MMKGLNFLDWILLRVQILLSSRILKGEKLSPCNLLQPLIGWFTKYRILLQHYKEGAQGDEAQGVDQLGNSYQRVSCPADSGIWKFPNLTTAFLSKNQKYVAAVEDKGCRAQLQKPLANHFLSHCFHKRQTLTGTSPSDQLSVLEKWEMGISYLLGKHTAQACLLLPFW